jgi:hypothetical protein
VVPESTVIRNIELLRDNIYRIIDIYHFLVNGDHNVFLRGLMLLDPATIKGYCWRAGKRPKKEMKRRNFCRSLFCLWFNEFAYTVCKCFAKQKSWKFLRDIKSSEFNTYKPSLVLEWQNFKSFQTESQLRCRFARYHSLLVSMRISDLIVKADGLKEDAYSKRARILSEAIWPMKL